MELSIDADTREGQCCPVEKTLEVLSSKWTILILRDLLTGTKRFGQLRQSLNGVSPRTLSQRLKELEAQGIVRRVIYPEVPPRVEYSLTEKGKSLSPILEQMRDWGSQFEESGEGPEQKA
ncbi:MAG: helix-turn-helix transcriptional regulator [Chloroflexi bacterium]|nr:helix-turn-helix transcriptional regulator [Chloroflexota bacterium]